MRFCFGISDFLSLTIFIFSVNFKKYEKKAADITASKTLEVNIDTNISPELKLQNKKFFKANHFIRHLNMNMTTLQRFMLLKIELMELIREL